jgi:ElaB/YqjD/DUF883 family membrane-anchored ribosome-binding protein
MPGLRISAPSAKHQHPNGEIEKTEIMAEENYMNQGPAVSPQVEKMGEQNRRQRTGPGSSDPGGNLQSSGASKRTEKLTQGVHESGQVREDARERVQTLRQNTDEYVRRNPAKAVFTALAIGFVLGLMRRR